MFDMLQKALRSLISAKPSNVSTGEQGPLRVLDAGGPVLAPACWEYNVFTNMEEESHQLRIQPISSN